MSRPVIGVSVDPSVGKGTQFKPGRDASEKGRRGGEKTGERRKVEVLMNMFMDGTCTDVDLIAKLEELGFKPDKGRGKYSNKLAILAPVLIRYKETGDPKALELILRIIGEEPPQKTEVEHSGSIGCTGGLSIGDIDKILGMQEK